MAIEMTPEEIEEIFREYNEAVARGLPIEEDLAERMRDASVGLRGYTFELKQNLDRIKSSTVGLVGALKDGQTGASVYNNAIESGADAVATFLKPLGPLGKIIGSIVGVGGKLISEVNRQTDALFKSYEDLTRFGAGVTTGIEGVMALSQQLGYTVGQLDSFTAMIGRNSQSLATMGGTAVRGAKQFGDLVKEVSPQREMWRRLGLDVEQQNEAYAGYLRILTLTGQSQRKTTSELSAGSQEYLHNLVTLSKITGQTVDELLTQREALLSEQRFLSAQRDLLKKATDAEQAGDQLTADRLRKQAEENEKLVNSVPKELRAGVADLTTGFVGSSQAALQIYRGMPEMANKIMSQNYDAADAVSVGEREASKRLDAFGKTLGGLGQFDEVFGPLVGYVKMENQARAGTFEQRELEAENEKARQMALQGATANQAKLREEQLRVTQNIQRAIGVLTGPVSTAMSGLTTAVGSATTALGNIAGTNQQGAAPGPGAGAQQSSAAPAASTASAAPAAAPAAPPAAPAAPPAGAANEPNRSATSALPINPAILRRQEEDERRRAERRGVNRAPAVPTPADGAVPNAVPTPADGAPSQNTPAMPPARRRAAHRRAIANEPFVPGRPLSKNQMSVIELGISMGNTYADDVMAQYNRQKSAEMATASNKPPTNIADPTPTVPGYEHGGIATGPKSGYQARLHGIEAVIPLAGGRSVPVEMPNFTSSLMGQANLMTAHIDKLDALISETRTNNALTQKLLRAAQA